jgi:hypothetical protein
VTDPGQLYFEPSGNVYNPQLQRELSQAGQQGSGGPPSGGGGAGGAGYGGYTLSSGEKTPPSEYGVTSFMSTSTKDLPIFCNSR